MKATAKRAMKSTQTVEARYRSAFDQYLVDGSETALGQAYEIGRKALADGKSIVEIVAIHHQSVQLVLREAKGTKDRERLLSGAADFLAESLSPYEMAHRGFHDAVRALRQLNETLEEEIKRIAYAVHDEAGQLLVAVYLALAEMAREIPEAQRARIDGIEALLKQVENQLRRYSHELRPTVLDDLGWIPAIRFLAERVSKRANLAIEIEAPKAVRLSSSAETAIYRVVQEALNNITKHANASQVRIQIRYSRDMVSCLVADDGAGFNARSLHTGRAQKGLGMISMRERLNAIGGTLSIESAPGQGTKLLAQLPRSSNGDSRRARR